MENKNEYLGTMYIAFRPCGKWVSMAWEDAFDKRIERVNWIEDNLEIGNTVEKVARYKGDPELEPICHLGCRDCLRPYYVK